MLPILILIGILGLVWCIAGLIDLYQFRKHRQRKGLRCPRFDMSFNNAALRVIYEAFFEIVLCALIAVVVNSTTERGAKSSFAQVVQF